MELAISMLTPSLFFKSSIAFGLFSLVLLCLLRLIWLEDAFRNGRRAVVLGASLFWLGFTILLEQVFWSGYYRYFYPEWMKWGIIAVALVIFPMLAFIFHWLACLLPKHPLIWFCLFAGFEAVIEHIVAWYGTGLPEKVPYLAGLPLFPVIVFAFFEYLAYWAIALWLAWLLTRISIVGQIHSKRRKKTNPLLQHLE
jgi:hypothetical protein